MYMEAIEVCEHWETIQDNQPTQAGHQIYLIVCQYQASGLQDKKEVCVMRFNQLATRNVKKEFGRYTNVKR
jgi:hypothetical protein